MQLPPVLTRFLLAQLFLLLMSPAVARGQTYWKFGAEAGEVRRTGGKIKHPCQTPNLLRFTSSEKFFRLEPWANAAPFGPRATRWLSATIDTTGLEPKTYHATVSIECIDCDPTKCHKEQPIIDITLYVLKPTSRRQVEESAEQKANAARIADDLRKEVQRVSREFEKKKQKPRPLKDTVIQNGEKMRVYDAAEVFKVIAETKQELLKAFKAKELQPFKVYAEKYFPTKLTTFSAEVGRAPAPQDLNHALRSSFRAARAPSAPRKVATAAAVQEAFENVEGFLVLVEANSGEFSLKVDSEPDEANVEVLQVDGTLLHQTLSNAPVHGMFPGTYIVRMKKDGYQEVKLEEDFGINYYAVVCKLVKPDAPRKNCQAQ